MDIVGDENGSKTEILHGYSGTAGELAQLVQEQIQGSKDSMQPIDQPPVQDYNGPRTVLSTSKITANPPVTNPIVGENSSSFEAMSKLYPFLLEHKDEYLKGLGFAFCNICQGKVSWGSIDTIIEHLETSKHSKIQMKIENRLKEFPWLELLQGVPNCAPCQKETPWKSLLKLKEHEETSEHHSRSLFYENNCKDEVKMESQESSNAVDEIKIQKSDIGQCIVEELKYLRASSERALSIVCADKIIHAHIEPFLLSTLLFTSLDDVNVETSLLCPGFSSVDVELALDVMYYGKAYPTSAEQKERVLRCLSDLNFIGSLGTDGTFSRGEHNNEKSMDWSTTRIEKVGKEDLEKSSMSRPSDLTIALRLRQFPDLLRVDDQLFCGFCDEKLDWRIRKNITAHTKSSKHIRAMAVVKEKNKEVVKDTVDDADWLDDSQDLIEDDEDEDEDDEDDEDEEDEEYEIENTPKRSSKKTGGPTSSRISLKTRLEQFKDLLEFEGEVVCRICKVVLEWTKRSRINDHMRSQKHIKAARKMADLEVPPELSEAERAKIHAQAQRVKSAGGRGNKKSESSDEEYEDESDVPIQGKLLERLEEFPWMKKLAKVEEVRCLFCKCPVNWERKSHIQDHMKSKKHMSALEQKKDRYPEVIEKINQIQPKYLKESDKPNNGDRLAYRIHLRQGTPAIQKLWGAALIIGTMTTQISMCYICFKLYLSQDELMCHITAEHPDTPNKSIHSPLFNKETKEFFCNGCNKYTEAKKSLMCFLVHNLICTKKFYNSPMPIRCFQCPEMFSVYKNFKDHLESTHENLLPERLMCTDCPQTFLTNEELKRHINQVHTEHVFSCSQCPSSFKNKHSLKEHVVKHHIGVKNFSCDTCGKEFFGKQNLRMHMRIHVAPENRPYACELCGMRFIERKHLLNHQATHTNDRPHKCHLCDSRFKVRDWLSNHYIKQHSISIKEVESKYKHLSRVGVAAAQYYQI